MILGLFTAMQACGGSDSALPRIAATGAAGAGNSTSTDGSMSTGGTGTNSGGASSSSGGNATVGGLGGASSLSGGNGGVTITLPDGAVVTPTNQACATQTTVGERTPLDMYFMIDISGSMQEEISPGLTRWDAVSQAIVAFFNDPQSAGISVGLQYFPLRKPGVPTGCLTDAECGAGAPCLLATCYCGNSPRCPRPPPIIPCSSAGDCYAGWSCVKLGECSSSTQLCLGPGLNYGGTCGTCNAFSASNPSACVNFASCTPSDYAMSAIPISLLPGAAPQLDGSITGTVPKNESPYETPTPPALAGAIQYTQGWSLANPAHTVVTVLATDGFPNVCITNTRDPTADVVTVAQQGFQGTPSIRTFVVGVFGTAKTTAAPELNRIAVAGGTSQAFLVDDSATTTQQFIDALNTIRGTALGCDYQIPASPTGQTLDYFRVNVRFTDPAASAPQTLYYVGSSAKCDPTLGGWYYDADPSTSAIPSRISVCPTNCTQFQATPLGRVDIELGCETALPPIL